MPTVKTRYAPSPTGTPHFGNIRTAAYAWLYAKKHGGTFFLRLEDTDQERLVPGTADALVETLKSIGLSPDEGFMGETVPEVGDNGPYVQSKCRDLYRAAGEELIRKDAAYYCFCGKRTEPADAAAPKELRDRACRAIDPTEAAKRVAAGEPHAIRHKVPDGEWIAFGDLVYGKQKILSDTLDDIVLLKGDGHATYHLAHLVDDHRQGTTHVFRGEEWLPSAPKHQLLFKQMGYEAPLYAHLPLIMAVDKETGNKRKFSKRKGDPTFAQLQTMGYLPVALLNYMAFLGWNPGKWETKEIYTREELIAAFSPEGINRSGALFDHTKLDWTNAQHLAKLSDDEYHALLTEHLAKYEPEFYQKTFSPAGEAFCRTVEKELRQRVRKFSEFSGYVGFLFGDCAVRPELMPNPKMGIVTLDDAKKPLELALKFLGAKTELPDLESLKAEYLPLIAAEGMKNGQALWPARVALSGEQFSPGAFELMSLLGPAESVRRITRCLQTMGR